MKFTILTPSYNQAQYLEENILSVLNQKQVEVEHIIIDGGSTDQTVEILEKYPHLKWVSEKDEGQADALQKGLEMATGDIIGWINSDDYFEKNILKSIELYFQSTDVDWIIGNITFFYNENRNEVKDKSPVINQKALFSNPDILRQQGTFFKREALIKAGGFDKQYHLCMDLDLWFRILQFSDPVMVDSNFAYFRVHKDQKTSGKQTSEQLAEMLDIFGKNNAGNYYKIKIRVRKVWFKIKLKIIKCVKNCLKVIIRENV